MNMSSLDRCEAIHPMKSTFNNVVIFNLIESTLINSNSSLENYDNIYFNTQTPNVLKIDGDQKSKIGRAVLPKKVYSSGGEV